MNLIDGIDWCEVYLHLGIANGNLDVSQLQNELQICSDLLVVEDRGEAGWNIKLTLGEKIGGDVNIYTESTKLIDGIKSSLTQIQNFITTNTASVCLCIHYWISLDENISTPAVGFEPEVIKFLSKLNAGIDIDIYKNGVD